MNNKSGVTIREATVTDCGAILDCLHTAFEPFRQDYTPEGFADTTLTLDTLRQRFASMQIFIAVSEGEMVLGTIACRLVSPERGHIRGMAVLPLAHGRGVAALLLSHVEDRLRSQGARRVTLNTTAPLQRAIHFYEKHGYRATGKVGDHFGMPLFEYEKQL